eukprot:3196394-Rhodomonas_salina.1
MQCNGHVVGCYAYAVCWHALLTGRLVGCACADVRVGRCKGSWGRRRRSAQRAPPALPPTSTASTPHTPPAPDGTPPPNPNPR